MPQGSERQVPPVKVDRWPGLMTNMNPHQIPPGGSVQQVNVTMIRESELDVRPGMREVLFEN